MREDGTTLADQSHELYVYKVRLGPRAPFTWGSGVRGQWQPADRCVCVCVCQCDEDTSFSNQALYLGLACCQEDLSGGPSVTSSLPFQRSTKETFWISTQLSSTKLTQNGSGSGRAGSAGGPAA